MQMKGKIISIFYLITCLTLYSHVQEQIQFAQDQDNFEPRIETKRFNFKKATEDQHQFVNNPYSENFNYGEEYLQNDEADNIYEGVHHQYQEYTPPVQKNNYDPSPYNDDNEDVEIEMGKLSLSLFYLERDKIPTLNIDQLEHLY